MARSDVLASRRRWAILIGCAVLAVVLFFLWKPAALNRPEDPYSNTIRMGIGEAPADTFVLLELLPWSEGHGTDTVVILGDADSIGQPLVSENGPTPFRIEFVGFVADDQESSCADRYDAGVCWSGTADVRVDARSDGNVVISGTFEPHGFARMDLTLLFGLPSENGPYRAFLVEVLTLEKPSDLDFPARGVHVQLFTHPGDLDLRLDSTYRPPDLLNPDGPTWIVEPPGTAIGVQLTDVNAETAVRSIADISGLLLGVVVALGVQISLEIVNARTTTTRPRASKRTGG